MRERHNLAWLTEQGWRECSQLLAPELQETLNDWMRSDHPAIVRRQDAAAAPDSWSLGIALPPQADGGVKKRICLCVSNDGIARTAPPLTLRDTIPAAPAAWTEALAELEHRATDAGLVLRVYGSLALQALTGRDYVKPSSDIDLLLTPASARQLATAMELLRQAAVGLPLDGEIVFTGGQGVSWKEWQAAGSGQNNARVLVKHLHGVRLATRAELLATLDGGRWVA